MPKTLAEIEAAERLDQFAKGTGVSPLLLANMIADNIAGRKETQEKNATGFSWMAIVQVITGGVILAFLGFIWSQGSSFISTQNAMIAALDKRVSKIESIDERQGESLATGKAAREAFQSSTDRRFLELGEKIAAIIKQGESRDVKLDRLIEGMERDRWTASDMARWVRRAEADFKIKLPYPEDVKAR